MRKNIFILAFMLSCCMAFAQSNLPFTSLMPWNIEIHYRKQHEGNLDANYHCLGFGMNYSLSKWIDAGFFVNSGTYKYQMTVSSNNIILFDGDSRDFFWKYGFNTKLHPLSLLFPNFTSIDVYFDGYLGAFSYTSDYWPKTNKFLYGAGVGIALYPTRHFGLFYERAYDNVNKITINQSNKVKPMNRFGINVRFGGPKKWRK